MIDFELKEILRKAYRAGRRNALKQDELNFNDFINKNESKLKLFAITVVAEKREQLREHKKETNIECLTCNDENCHNYFCEG